MNSKTFVCVLLAALVFTSVGCKRGNGDECAKPEDCATGLTCYEPPHISGPSCMTPSEVQADKDKDCRPSEHCTEYGLCTGQGGKCVATLDADCRASSWCAELGRCTAKDGKCIATDADCRATKGCTDDGRCTAKNGECFATLAHTFEMLMAAMCECKDSKCAQGVMERIQGFDKDSKGKKVIKGENERIEAAMNKAGKCFAKAMLGDMGGGAADSDD